MASKLTWEWTDTAGGDKITLVKKKGRITVEEIFEFMSSQDAVWAFGEGTMWVIANRIREESYQGWDLYGKPEGDAVDVWILGDDSKCFCGRTLHTSYCPECGAKLYEE